MTVKSETDSKTKTKTHNEHPVRHYVWPCLALIAGQRKSKAGVIIGNRFYLQHAGRPRLDGLSQWFEVEAGAGQMQMRDLKHTVKSRKLVTRQRAACDRKRMAER